MEQQEGTEEHQWRHQGDHREAKGKPVGWAMPNMLFFSKHNQGSKPKVTIFPMQIRADR